MMADGALIRTSVPELWRVYGGDKPSGRFECPISVVDAGEEITVTHIYRGYGQIRLERIEGHPFPRKGFQGENVTPRDHKFLIRD
jgi:hypothetical protein